MFRLTYAIFVFFILSLFAPFGVTAEEIKLPAIFGDHMVLQQKKTIPVWGTANPQEKISVTLQLQDTQRKTNTIADAKGRWRVDLEAVQPSPNAATLVIAGKKKITFNDVLIGDVWLASGQSNMEFGLTRINRSEEALADGKQPTIRLFTVPRAAAITPKDDIGSSPDAIQGKWQLCTPETLAKDGTPAGFSAVAYFFARELQKVYGRPIGLISSTWGGTPAESWVRLDVLDSDPRLRRLADSHRTILAHYDAATASLPRELAEFKVKDAEWARTAKPVNDAARKKWLDEVAAATATGQPPPPHYPEIPEPRRPDPTGGPTHATNLYNGMIAPLIPFAIEGVIWYQGEANEKRGEEYAYLFPLLIESWRQQWGEGNFPFLYVQLPNFNGYPWALVREAQLHTLSLAATGMAVTTDLGTLSNIHPPYKREVASRLALVARHVAYGEKVLSTGPMYKSMAQTNGTIRLAFDGIGSGLIMGTTPLSGSDIMPAPTDKLVKFTIAGEDRSWFPAKASIEGDTVVVSAPEVPHPVAVRCGWDALALCNLYNKEGLPASPFRTDHWPVEQPQ